MLRHKNLPKMKKTTIAQINVEAGYGSTGKIAEMISRYAHDDGMESYLFYGRKNPNTDQPTIKIGNKLEQSLHLMETRLLDRHGKGSSSATKALINDLENLKVDILHLHNLHGYYLNYEILFEYIKKKELPVVWTLHDCWAFTGHCTHFEYVGCEKWKTKCYDCELLSDFPSSFFKDRSEKNFLEKKKAFNGIKNMVLVPVSQWLNDKLTQSFLKNYRAITIGNGIDLDTFNGELDLPVPKYFDSNKKTILGVASVWQETKGFQDFIEMSTLLNDNEQMILVGLSKKQLKNIPDTIIGIERTQNKKELIQLYVLSDAFMNLTYADTYPTTNIEAMACGTPVIAYKTGGCTEMINENNGRIVEVGAYEKALEEFRLLCKRPLDKNKIVSYAKQNFDSAKQLKKYLEIYNGLVG